MLKTLRVMRQGMTPGLLMAWHWGKSEQDFLQLLLVQGAGLYDGEGAVPPIGLGCSVGALPADQPKMVLEESALWEWVTPSLSLRQFPWFLHLPSQVLIQSSVSAVSL